MSCLYNRIVQYPCYNIDIRDEENKTNLTPKQNNKWVATNARKETKMKLNHMNKTIELTMTENRAASKYKSDMYNTLHEVRQEYPTYTIVVTKKTTNRKSNYRGLNYQFMEKYIKAHDENEAIMKEFNTLRGKDNDELSDLSMSASYVEIKKWFLTKYPAIAEYDQQISKILNSAKAA